MDLLPSPLYIVQGSAPVRSQPRASGSRFYAGGTGPVGPGPIGPALGGFLRTNISGSSVNRGHATSLAISTLSLPLYEALLLCILLSTELGETSGG
jgi:hypothetical protein